MTVVKSLSAVVTDNDNKPPHRRTSNTVTKKLNEANFDKTALFMGTFKAEDQEA